MRVRMGVCVCVFMRAVENEREREIVRVLERDFE